MGCLGWFLVVQVDRILLEDCVQKVFDRVDRVVVECCDVTLSNYELIACSIEVFQSAESLAPYSCSVCDKFRLSSELFACLKLSFVCYVMRLLFL